MSRDVITPDDLREARYRNQRGLTREIAAAVCGVDITTYRRWERGRARIPFSANRELALDGAGELPATAGTTWDGWLFVRGVLVSPEGETFTPGAVRALWWVWQRLAAWRGQENAVGRRETWPANVVPWPRSGPAHAITAALQVRLKEDEP